MSRRELKALTAGIAPQLRESRLRSGRMSDTEEQQATEPRQDQNLQSLVEQLRAENEQLRSRSDQTERRLGALQRATTDATEEAARLGKLLDEVQARAELERLRAVEDVRSQHQRALHR